MKFNFDEIISRRNTNSVKWDEAADPEVLPLWVADMDFRVAPAIVEALRHRVEQGIFGYTHVPDAYYEAVINWFARRHGWTIARESVVYTIGVVPAVSAVIKALTVPGDKVLIQTPVYNCFFSSIRNNGCEIAESPLLRMGNTYRMDYDDLERQAADPRVKVMLLCNPHNPACRVWTREELTRLGEICLRHGVTVVSDEIHCELVAPGHRYTPYALIANELGQHSVSCISASKSFNIAGLQIANIVAPDSGMRAGIDRAINVNEVCDVNPFGVLATIAAYNEGEEWLSQLNEYIYGNYCCLRDFCREHLPEFPVMDLDGTYLAWMDCSALGWSSKELEEILIRDAKLWLNAGTMYGAAGEGFMRWNMACPRSVLSEGLKRFEAFVRRR